jgi:hypothetical protein
MLCGADSPEPRETDRYDHLPAVGSRNLDLCPSARFLDASAKSQRADGRSGQPLKFTRERVSRQTASPSVPRISDVDVAGGRM